MLRALNYSLTEATASLLRGWRAAILAIVTIAAGLFVLGFFMIVNTNVRQVVQRWSDAAELSVYMRDDATGEQVQAVTQLITASGLAADSHYVSKADAAKRFAEEFPDLTVAAQGLGRSPFPASVEVQLASHSTSSNAVDTLAATLKAAPGVADVQYDRRWLARLNSIIRFAGGIGILVIAMLAVAAALTVANVVRLAAHARREEIEIMQLVGAPLGYIRGPFIAEGVLQGGVGALAAIVLLWVVFTIGRARFGQLAADALGLGTLSFLPLGTVFLLLTGGMLLGCIGGLIVARAVR